MTLFIKNKTLQFGFVVAAALISIHLWSFRGISKEVYDILEAIVLLGLIVIILGNTYVFNKQGLLFKTNVHLFLWLPYLSAIGAYLYHNQPLHLSVILLRPQFLWLFYFVLHAFAIPKKKVIHLMIFIGCTWAFLTVVQQFTHPFVLFYSRSDDEGGGGEYRAGVYRFMVGGMQYGLFILLYFFYQYLISKGRTKTRNIPFILAGLLGFYYFGTRQFAATAVLCMGVAVMYLNARLRTKYIALMAPFVIIMWMFRDVFFGEYIALTSQQMEYGYESDIRALSAEFWLNDYWPHWATKILGNGPPHMLSEYGRESELIRVYFHFYRSDVGLIGTYNKFGILYVLNIIWVTLRVIIMKIPDKQDLYLKLFFFNVIFLSVTNESFSSEGVIPFYCFLLYLIDKSIEEYKNRPEILEEGIPTEQGKHQL
jgi:hypothetical protein